MATTIHPKDLVQLRTIPQEHFCQELTNNQSDIDFLPNIQINVLASDEQKQPLYIKKTSVNSPILTEDERQITACFDISCRPIGSTLTLGQGITTYLFARLFFIKSFDRCLRRTDRNPTLLPH